MNKKMCIAAVLILAAELGAFPLAASDGVYGPLSIPVRLFPTPVDYNIEFDPDYAAGSLSAVCRLTIRNDEKEPLAIVPLNLYRLFSILSVTDGKGNSLEFDQAVMPFEDWPELQVSHVRVKLAPPLPPGGVTELQLAYEGPLRGYTEAMAYVKDHIGMDLTLLRSDCLAFPEIGIPSWKTNRALGLRPFTYRLTIPVPPPLVAANGGRLAASKAADGRVVYIYESKVPSWRIDLAVSRYKVIGDQTGRFRIFAFPADIEGARTLMTRLGQTMDLFSKWFGPAPDFAGLTVIEIPAGYGSQADAAAIIQEEAAFKSTEGHYTLYHELSHLWDVRPLDPAPPRFESEGLAMFMQHYVQEKLEGRPGAVREAVAKSVERLAKTFTDHPEQADVPMIRYGENGLTDLSYRMGQIMFYLLHETMGDRNFLKAAAGWRSKYRGRGATAAQFVEYFKGLRPAGPLGRIMRDWVLTPRGAGLIRSGATLERLRDMYRPSAN